MWRAVLLSPGRPERAMEVFGVRAAPGFPAGVYETATEVGLWIIVLHELPETRDTLCLRVLARGEVQRRAIRELRALPAEAWERRLIEILLRWRIEVAIQATLSADDEDFMTTTHDLFEEFTQKLRHESLAKGLDPLAHQFERRLGRALTAGERDTLVARLSTLGSHRLGDVVLDLAPDDLAAWLADPSAR